MSQPQLWQQLSPKINKHTYTFKILSPYSVLFCVFFIQNIVEWWVEEDSGLIKKPVLDKSLCNFFLPHRVARGILVPWPGVEPETSAVKAQSPNHWSTREFPSFVIFIWGILFCNSTLLCFIVSEETSILRPCCAISFSMLHARPWIKHHQWNNRLFTQPSEVYEASHIPNLNWFSQQLCDRHYHIPASQVNQLAVWLTLVT